jgi:hypothetical protein
MMMDLNAIFWDMLLVSAIKYRPWQTKIPLVDLLIVSIEGRRFLVKMFFKKSVAQLLAAGSVVLFALATTAMADITPVDPHGLFADGGDATPLCIDDVCSGPLTLSDPNPGSDTGGGIFVFNNNTGMALSAVDVDITLPNSFLNGFSFTGTIYTPGGGASSVSETIVTHACGDPLDTTSFCVEMAYAVNPGPLVPVGGNFTLDFDKPVSDGPPPVYGGVDELVATGNYSVAGCEASELPNCTGTTDTSNARIGEWADGATGFVTPVFATPEPRQYAGLLAGILALAFFLRRKSAAAAR